MTGYGHSEVSKDGKSVIAEVRSVNSRYLELTTRLPKNHLHRDNEVREIVQKKLERGKINVFINFDVSSEKQPSLSINKKAAHEYYRLLNDLKIALKLDDKITIDHLMHFSEIIESQDVEQDNEAEWQLCVRAINQALDGMVKMRQKEGNELKKDLNRRVSYIEKTISMIEKLSPAKANAERKRLKEKVNKLISDFDPVVEKRIELEIIMLSEKLDVTEECVRLKTHCKYFKELMNGSESSGRKLNFLIQELNREANTIGSKSNDVKISHLAVKIKEELEKIREQIQNIE